jgi:hypothetical protein
MCSLIKTSAVLSLVLLLSVEARAGQRGFDNSKPTCQMPAAAPVLPKKYERLRWARNASPAALQIYGQFDDGGAPPVSVWYDFQKSDIDADGYCDWLGTLTIPHSSGGDRSSVNVIYRGRPRGWERIGPPVAARDYPVDLGTGAGDDDYDWFEDAATLRDKATNKVYVIGAFRSRHTSARSKPGYHVYAWEQSKHTFVELDKWGDGRAPAAKAYAYFKEHGAFGGENGRQEFDHDIEQGEMREAERELKRKCRVPVSPPLPSKCAAARTHFPEWFHR